MKNNWKDFVQFSNSERRGIITLSLLAILSAALSYFVPQWVSQKEINKFENQYAAALKKARDSDFNTRVNLQKEANKTTTLDTIPKEYQKTNAAPIAPVAKAVLQLNSMSANELIRSGLVEAQMAYRIVKFRDGLGGFHSKSQIKEVFEVSEELYSKLISNTEFNAVPITKINLNNATTEELQAHAYISKKLAQQIINFREKYKPFESSEDVLKLYMVDEKLHKKLMPYISF